MVAYLSWLFVACRCLSGSFCGCHNRSSSGFRHHLSLLAPVYITHNDRSGVIMRMRTCVRYLFVCVGVYAPMCIQLYACEGVGATEQMIPPIVYQKRGHWFLRSRIVRAPRVRAGIDRGRRKCTYTVSGQVIGSRRKEVSGQHQCSMCTDGAAGLSSPHQISTNLSPRHRQEEVRKKPGKNPGKTNEKTRTKPLLPSVACVQDDG